jgi:hypothetical protein
MFGVGGFFYWRMQNQEKKEKVARKARQADAYIANSSDVKTALNDSQIEDVSLDEKLNE